jgi:homocysteine S-methyltransferase
MTNVVIVGGDDLTEREQQYAVKQVRDFTSTGLIAATADMNRGMDYRGANLQAPTRLCIGGAIDLGKPFESEARLAVSKVEAGAEFLITQPIYSPAERRHFLELFESVAGRPLDVPVFWGLQVLTGDGLVFGDVPTAFRRQLESGTPGTYIATQVLTQLVADGVDGVYLVPPIMRGGARDYDAAAQVLRATFG